MNWRAEIKDFFTNKTLEAIGDDLKYFAPYNSQLNNSSEETTRPELGVFFEYGSVNEGLEYLKSQNIRHAEYIPVEAVIHIVFNSYNADFQDRAYDYAYKLCNKVIGKKHELILGVITKGMESEDVDHKAPYDYQITFMFNVKEITCEEIELIDINPESGQNPNTGFTLDIDTTAYLV